MTSRAACSCCRALWRNQGPRFSPRSTLKKRWILVCSRHPQIVLTDLVMPNINGIELLERIMEIDPATDVFLMTAHYSAESAVEAIKKGARDCLNKPIQVENVVLVPGDYVFKLTWPDSNQTVVTIYDATCCE